MDKIVLSKEIQQPYLDWIKSGEKVYEGRLKTKIEEWGLKIGRRIKFYDKENPDSWVLIDVTSLPTFADFGTAYDVLGSELIPHKTKNEVIKLYNDLFHNSDEKINDTEPSQMIKDKGVIAFGMRVITMRPLLQ
ncbi:hypothetical protein Klosneuvirus_2_252 [Klosneuvirus KNV1]|uniref:Uncharacterized protein n=1 Tax=Klosneuvirus KNV1 TaxID=1977640 RepID=A0A1V0SJB3_9VIRU|nr:hypothetical protein Klosneuvirus_2_252 [Klosneuvirus KNV1]